MSNTPRIDGWRNNRQRWIREQLNEMSAEMSEHEAALAAWKADGRHTREEWKAFEKKHGVSHGETKWSKFFASPMHSAANAPDVKIRTARRMKGSKRPVYGWVGAEKIGVKLDGIDEFLEGSTDAFMEEVVRVVDIEVANVAYQIFALWPVWSGVSKANLDLGWIQTGAGPAIKFYSLAPYTYVAKPTSKAWQRSRMMWNRIMPRVGARMERFNAG